MSVNDEVDLTIHPNVKVCRFLQIAFVCSCFKAAQDVMNFSKTITRNDNFYLEVS